MAAAASLQIVLKDTKMLEDTYVRGCPLESHLKSERALIHLWRRGEG